MCVIQNSKVYNTAQSLRMNKSDKFQLEIIQFWLRIVFDLFRMTSSKGEFHQVLNVWLTQQVIHFWDRMYLFQHSIENQCNYLNYSYVHLYCVKSVLYRHAITPLCFQLYKIHAGIYLSCVTSKCYVVFYFNIGACLLEFQCTSTLSHWGKKELKGKNYVILLFVIDG